MMLARLPGVALLALAAVAALACDTKKEPAAATEAGVVPPEAAAPTPAVVNAPPFETRCIKDDDCVPAPGCCPVPCTEHVINRRDLARANEQNAKSCPPAGNCISAGGCRTHAYLCVRNSCKLVYAGSPDYRAR